MKETKTRKKSAILAAIVLLLVAVIALGAMTYAKYVTSTTVPTKQATVAKWGFTVTANADDLFSDAYNKGGKVDATVEGTAVEVKASGLTVAPGTSGSMIFSVKGSAEVLAQLTIEAKGTDVALKDAEGNVVYNPVKWTVKKGGAAVVTDGTLVDVIAALNTTATYQPGAEAVNDEYEISWAWAFDGGNDEYDTILGQFANDTDVDGYMAVTSITFDLAVSVEQIQNA